MSPDDLRKAHVGRRQDLLTLLLVGLTILAGLYWTVGG